MQCLLMIFKIYKCFVIFVCIEYAFGITEAADDACTLPNGAQGECVALPACTQYVVLLKESTTTELGLRLTQETRCGLEGNNPKVCCPTMTEVPDAKVRTNLTDSDFVDELPEPGICGKKYIEPALTVWNGKPVKTRRAVNISYDASQIPDPPPEVARGTPLVRWEQAPWMAILAYKLDSSTWTWECGGSIITKRHVLTAAHCIRESLYVVRVGELDFAQKEKEFEPIDYYIKKKIRHELYTAYHNDIGILVLDGSIPIDGPDAYKYVTPVCLPDPGLPYEKTCLDTFINGWGEKGENGTRPTNLLYAHVDIIDQDTCKSDYKDESLTIDERVFCAGDPNGHDACNGDSGGPLIGNYFLAKLGYFHYQIGIISYGFRCSAKRYTGVYTNISHFMPWIREKVTGKTEPRQWTITTSTNKPVLTRDNLKSRGIDPDSVLAIYFQ